MKIVKEFQNTVISTVGLLYPPACSACNSRLVSGEDTLCYDCWQELRNTISKPACPTCGKPASQYEIFNNKCHLCQKSSSRSILVMWTEVPTDQQNGIITGYTITYKSQTEYDNGNVAVNVSVRQMELTSLNKFFALLQV